MCVDWFIKLASGSLDISRSTDTVIAKMASKRHSTVQENMLAEKFELEVNTLVEKVELEVDTIVEKVEQQVDTIAEKVEQQVDTIVEKLPDKDHKIPQDRRARIKRCGKTLFDCLQHLGQCRLAGLVMGPVYGVLIYLYVTHLILAGPPFTARSSKNSINCNPLEISCFNEGQFDAGEIDVALMSKRTSHLIGGCTGAAVGSGLTIISVFSTRTRCTMVLVFPSLLTKRGRSFMFSFAIALLIEGPLSNLEFNIQEVTRSFTCLYEGMKSMAQRSADEFVQIMKQVKDVIAEMNKSIKDYILKLEEDLKSATAETRAKIEAMKQEAQRKLNKMRDFAKGMADVINAPSRLLRSVCSWFGRKCKIPNIVNLPDVSLPDGVSLDALRKLAQRLKPDLDVIDMNLDSIAGNVDASSIESIRERLKGIFSGAFAFLRKISKWTSKICYLTILLIFFDAHSYERSFYVDDAFDNITINASLKKFCKKENKRKVTPMRYWELKETYQLAVRVKLSAEERIRLLKSCLPCIVITVVTTAIVIMDFLFAMMLEVFRENASFGISFPGMEAGVSFGGVLKKAEEDNVTVIKVEGYNLSTAECLPRPQKSGFSSIFPIFIIVFAALLSCVVETYLGRLRPLICNSFYFKREEERARFLYKKIRTGRKVRQRQLSLILDRELTVREREKEFSPIQRFMGLIRRQQSGPIITSQCLGCHKHLQDNDTALYTFKHKGEKIQMEICSDCVKDPHD